MEKLTTIGLDIAKNVFQLHGVDAAGNVLLRKQLRRGDVLLQSWCQHPDNRPLFDLVEGGLHKSGSTIWFRPCG